MGITLTPKPFLMLSCRFYSNLLKALLFAVLLTGTSLLAQTSGEEAAAKYQGHWKIDEAAGDTAYLYIKPRGRASVFWSGMASDKIEQGSWTFEDGKMTILWDSGYSDVLEFPAENTVIRKTFSPSAVSGSPMLEARGERLDPRMPGSLTVPPTGPRETPATFTAGDLAISAMRSPFIGYWEVRQGGGMLSLNRREYFYLHLNRDGKANQVQRNWDDEMAKQVGSWSVVDGHVHIVWPSGHKDMLRKKADGSMELLSYTPRQSIGGNVDATFPATQITASAAVGLFQAGQTRLFSVEDFVGFWRIDDRRQDLRPHLEIERWGNAYRFRDPNNPAATREAGTWSISQSGIIISWPDDSQDTLEISPTGYFQKSFNSGASLASAPATNAKVRRISRNEAATAEAYARARQRAEEETRRQKEAEDRLRAQADARRSAEEEARRLAEEEQRQRALAEAERRSADVAAARAASESEARAAAEAEARRVAELEARSRAEGEALARARAAAEEEMRMATEAVAKSRPSESEEPPVASVSANPEVPPATTTTETISGTTASDPAVTATVPKPSEPQVVDTAAREAEAKARAEAEERRMKEAAEAERRLAEAERRRQEAIEAEARQKAAAEALARQRAEAEAAARAKAEAEAQARAEAEARRKAEAEAQARAEAEARARASAEQRARPPQFTGLQPAAATAPMMEDLLWSLVFEEKFNETSLDSGLWTSGYPTKNIANNELSGYTDEALRVRDGALVITARDRPVTYGGRDQPYSSGALTTFGKFEQAYGYFEARVRITEGKGLWPNFWLFSNGQSAIRVFDAFGNEPDRIYHTVVSSEADGTPVQKSFQRKGLDLSWEYQIIGVMWTPSAVIFHVNGEEIGRVTENIPDEPMSLVLSMAVGGNAVGAPDGWTPFPSYYWIDWVRVFKLAQ